MIRDLAEIEKNPLLARNLRDIDREIE